MDSDPKAPQMSARWRWSPPPGLLHGSQPPFDMQNAEGDPSFRELDGATIEKIQVLKGRAAMRKSTPLLILCLIFIAGNARALTLSSLVPSRGVPGTRVTIAGGPFSARAQVVIGSALVAPVKVGQEELIFEIPPLAAGRYALTVRDGDRVATQEYLFEVVEPAPEISSLTPRNVAACSDEAERRVVIEGKNFTPEAKALVNGSAVPSRRIDRSSLELQMPYLAAGVYGVQVRNPGGAVTLPYSLWVNDIPAIASVEQGEESVNHYEVIIRGRNFFYNSSLLVTESDFSEGSPRRLTLHAYHEQTSLSPNISSPQSDNLRYRDCRTLVYERYPSSYQTKELILQVVNPDGKKSEPYPVSLP